MVLLRKVKTDLPGGVDHGVVLREGLTKTVGADEKIIDTNNWTASFAAL